MAELAVGAVPLLSGDAHAQRALRHPSFVVGGALVLLLLATAALSLVWTPHPAAEIDIPNSLEPPSARTGSAPTASGATSLRSCSSARSNSIVVGIVAVGIGLAFGVALGLPRRGAARLGRGAVMRSRDFTFAFPALLSAIMLTAIYGPGLYTSHRRDRHLQRAGVRAHHARRRRTRLVARVRACGARLRQGRLAHHVDHVLPNIASLLIVQATIQFAIAILAEAALSYLGLGTQPPQPSWGRMLNEAQTHDVRGTAARDLARPGHRAVGARPQPDGRRAARPARPQTRAARDDAACRSILFPTSPAPGARSA